MPDGIPLAGSVLRLLVANVRQASQRKPARHAAGTVRSVGAGAGHTLHPLGPRLRVRGPTSA
eukprot:2385245-Rhodomonas_salina.1